MIPYLKHSLLIPAIFICHSVKSQSNLNLKALAETYNVNGNNEIDFIKLKNTTPVYEMNSEAFLKSVILSNGVTVKKLSSEIDDLGFSHIRYELEFNNIPVHNTQLITHSQSGKLISLNGNLSSVTKPLNQISITENQAFELALKKVNAKLYKWENKTEEKSLRKSFNNPEFSFYPKAKTIVYSKETEGKFKNYYAYLFSIYADIPLYGANVIVDAQTGDILAEENLIHEIDVPSTAITRFSGLVSFTTDSVSPGLYRLQETGRGLGIETYDLNTSQTFSLASDYTNTTSAWTNTTTIDQVGTDAHWGAENVYDYYLTEHSRNSIDNAGHKLISYADYGVGYANAFWNGFFMTYGSGSSGGFTGLDICGHEVTHGLTSKTSNLTYQYESGALNESYSDIFGACIEKFGKPGSFNWIIGEDVGIIRNMSNPNALGDPDTYNGTNWYTGSGDNGGVHTNSGVSNFWFYLLTQGGSGTNDLAHTYTVSGLGMTKAAKIAFRALTIYYTPSTNYANARNLSVQAATDLYGACSNEVFQTKSAWYAVGVGASPSGTNAPIANFTSFGGSPCSIPFTANFNNATFGGDTYVWDFGDGSSVSTATNPVHTYTANGSYNVKLKATSACASVSDSITKNAHFIISGLTAASATSSAPKCDSGSFVLSASGSNQMYWYSNASGSGTPLHVGNTYTTPVVYSNTTYYVVNTSTNPSIYGGPLSNTIGTGANFPSNAAYDSLSVMQPCTLKSVVVYAASAGNRIFELRNSSNTVLQSKTVNLTVGSNTISLNFKLNTGFGYRLGLGASTAMLYRNNSGVTFPYTIGSLINITGSSAGPSQFFFFYNWEVAPDNCSSSPVAVTSTVYTMPTVTSATICSGQTATLVASGASTYLWSTGANTSSIIVSPSSTNNYSVVAANGCYSVTPVSNVFVNPLPVLNISSSQSLACTGDGLVTLTATPGGGTFTGTSVNANSFDPSVGVGTYTISYFYVDNNGCANTNSMNIVVSSCIGIEEYNGGNGNIVIYPNPFEDKIFIKSLNNTEFRVKITNALGEVVFDKNTISEIDNLNKLSQGIYFIEIMNRDSILYRIKLIKQ